RARHRAVSGRPVVRALRARGGRPVKPMLSRLAFAFTILATVLVGGTASGQELGRNFAGSIQLDYLAVPTEDVARKSALDGATAEVSLKLAMDFSPNLSANVKICYACHGFEVGMALFYARIRDH